MNNNIDFNLLWDKYSRTSVAQTMIQNYCVNSLVRYVESEVFNEYRFNKKMKDRIISDIRLQFFDLINEDFYVKFIEFGDLIIKILELECKRNKYSTRKIDNIVSELKKNVEITQEVENILNLLVKSEILTILYQNELFEQGYTIKEIDELTPNRLYIMDQLRD